MATPLRLIVLCIVYLVRRFFQSGDFSLLRVSLQGIDLLFQNESQDGGVRLWASPCGPRRHERRRQAVSALQVSAADAKGRQCRCRSHCSSPWRRSLMTPRRAACRVCSCSSHRWLSPVSPYAAAFVAPSPVCPQGRINRRKRRPCCPPFASLLQLFCRARFRREINNHQRGMPA